MRYPWIDEYLLGKKGVSKDLQKDWNWIRYQIGGKMFAAVCLDEQDKPYYINPPTCCAGHPPKRGGTRVLRSLQAFSLRRCPRAASSTR